jgi:RNA recognition motif-containing protein
MISTYSTVLPASLKRPHGVEFPTVPSTPTQAPSVPVPAPSTSSSPSKRSRTRFHGWDIAPSGLTQSGASPPIPVNSSSSPATNSLSPISALPLNPAQRLSARVYVGSIYYHITEEILRSVFSPFGLIVKIDVPKELGRSKGFAFIEYSTLESAMAAIRVMNGVFLHGRPMKLGRPPGAVEDPSYLPAALQLIAKLNIAQLQNPITNPALTAGMSAAGLPMTVIPSVSSSSPLSVTVPSESSPLPTSSTPSPSNAAQLNAQANILLISSSSNPLTNPLLSALVTSSAGLSKTRVYIGNLAWELSEEHIRAVFDAVGKIKSLQLVMDPATGNTKHRGYCFIDFEEEKSAAVAIQMGQAGFQIMGRPLKVNYASATGLTPVPSMPAGQLPIAPSVPIPSSSAAAILNAASQSLIDPANSNGSSAASVPASFPFPIPVVASAPQSISREENLRISSHTQRSELMSKLMKKAGSETVIPAISTVVLLKNLVTPSEVDPQLESEVSSECSKFGQVQRVKIHTDTLLEKVYIYVEFSSIDEALKAQESLNGRWFNYRTVQANFYPKIKFDAAIYTDTD